jgi:hypothetical protein
MRSSELTIFKTKVPDLEFPARCRRGNLKLEIFLDAVHGIDRIEPSCGKCGNETSHNTDNS